MLRVLIDETEDEITKIIFKELEKIGLDSRWEKIENADGSIAGLVIYQDKENGVARLLYYI